MSQKTDPTSLRLQKTNKHFSSSWYSDCFYSQMIVNDLQTRSYLEGLSEQIGQSQMFSYTQRYYKRAYTYLFFLDAREIRNQRERILRLSRKGQKHAASIAASTAFLRSCFNYKRGDRAEIAPSVVLPVSPLDSTKRDQVSLNCIESKARHLLRSAEKAAAFRGAAPEAVFGAAPHKRGEQIETQSKKAQISSGKAQTPYSYWWKESLKKLPVFKFGFKQTFFIRLAFNCSIFRDIVVQNCNSSNKNAKLMSSQTTTSQKGTHSTERYVGTKDVLLISCNANVCYPLDKDSKRQFDTNLLERGKVSLEARKLAQPVEDPFVANVPDVYPNSFNNLCAVGQLSSKQRACLAKLASLDMCSAQQSVSISNVFHATTEAAFLLADSVLNSLAKKQEKKRVSASASRQNSTDLCFLGANPRAVLEKRAVGSPDTLAPLKSHVEHIGLYATRSSAPSKALCFVQLCQLRAEGTHHMQRSCNLLAFDAAPRKAKAGVPSAETCNTHRHSILTSIYPIRIVQGVQFAGFLAQEIAYLLQKGVSFKQVQNRILSEHKKNEIIKGIRLSCSGRIGGRSKKAQKSKTQSVQWGETSLHVLSSKLSFASKSANTPFGKIGIKLWLCFQ